MLEARLTSATTIPPAELESLLKKDIRFLLAFIAPSVPPAKHMDEVEDLITRYLLSKSEFRALRNSLLKAGYWRLSPEGGLEVSRGHIDLGELSSHQFTNMCLGLLTRISPDGPCNYENLFIVTNAELKRGFYREVNRALKDLVDRSKTADGDRILGWTHIGIDFGNLDGGMLTKMDLSEKEKK
jgi:hypothetical protein